MLFQILAGIILLGFGALWRIYSILPGHFHNAKRARRHDETCSLGIFLGSGGHTSEMLQLLAGLDLDRYTPRTYIYCTGDSMSVANAVASEERRMSTEASSRITKTKTSKEQSYALLELPRARKVAQPLLSSAFSSLYTLAFALWHLVILPTVSKTEIGRDREEARKTGGSVRRPIFDTVLLNGPGTCVVLVLVFYIMKFFGLPSPTIIYVESFARVSSLSLSGKILHHLADRFIVQWDPKRSKGATTPASVIGGSNGEKAKRDEKPLGRWDRREYFGWLI